MTIACEAGAQSGALEIVAALLQYRASPDRADACGNTPLMWACEANATSVAELLLNAGACPRRVNSDGDAALGIALKHAHHGALKHAHNCFGSTPLVELIKLATDATHAPLLRRRVLLHGLSARPELNGRTGVAVSFDPNTGRYGVQLDGSGGRAEKVALRPANLLGDDAAADDAADAAAFSPAAFARPQSGIHSGGIHSGGIHSGGIHSDGMSLASTHEAVDETGAVTVNAFTVTFTGRHSHEDVDETGAAVAARTAFPQAARAALAARTGAAAADAPKTASTLVPTTAPEGVLRAAEAAPEPAP